MEKYNKTRATQEELILGTLLHDIGKFLQRASNSISELDLFSKHHIEELETLLCPKHRDGYYTHRHALFTYAFFEMLAKDSSFYNLLISLGLNYEKIQQIASYHHKPLDEDSYICSIADRYSAGMDRHVSDEPQDFMNKGKYKEIPLISIFSEIIINENLPNPEKLYNDIVELNPYSENIIPKPLDEIQGLPSKYKDLWQKFFNRLSNFNLPYHQNIIFLNIEEYLLGLLERYTWAIPSSTLESPDISLFDHLKTTAAIAICLYQYHNHTNTYNLKEIENHEIKKFRFLVGDLSGIQQTLFTLAYQGVKGVNKILRARSFLLSAIVESACIQCVYELNLSYSNIINHAGGRFIILIPNIHGIEEKVNKLIEKFDKWLLDNYTGTLTINLSLSKPFEGQKFFNKELGQVLSEVNTSVELSKLKQLSKIESYVLKREFPLNRECSACGIRPAINRVSFRCNTCEREFKIGEALVHEDLLIWYHDYVITQKQQTYDVLGLKLAIDNFIERPYLSMKCISPERDIVPMKYIANYVPKFNEKEINKESLKRYPNEEGLREVSPDQLKTFQHLAYDALEYIESEDTFIGRPYLSILKADVDFLGFIFSYGLWHKDTNKLTLSRLSQLSRLLDLYFTGYLQYIIRKNHPLTYTVYAGGDDLLLLGPWRQMLYLAKDIKETFTRYVANNPHITLSAGLSLLHSNYPVNRAVEIADYHLDLSKEHGRNSICAIIPKPYKWDKYFDLLDLSEWITDQLRQKSLKKVSTSFLYKLFLILKDAEEVKEGIKNKKEININKLNWMARLVYHLSRNLNKKNEEHILWLTKLGIEKTLDIKDDASLYYWRLPLTIALYRNRK